MQVEQGNPAPTDRTVHQFVIRVQQKYVDRKKPGMRRIQPNSSLNDSSCNVDCYGEAGGDQHEDYSLLSYVYMIIY